MEVEARFAIPDHETALRLQRVVRLGPFTPGEATRKQVRDSYLDTVERALYQNGYACRLREEDGWRLVTIKGLGDATSAVHRRFESEVTLPADAGIEPGTWPEGEVRDLVLSWTGDAPLNQLFVVDQQRYVRHLLDGQRTVAEWSIDEVQVDAGGRRVALLITEAELTADGTSEDLDALVRHLVNTWGLEAEHRSKFHIGLDLLEQAKDEPSRLSTAEWKQLAQIIEGEGDDRSREWARLVLGWGQGVPVRTLAEQMGLSRSWAYELLKRFREQRMALFGVQPADADRAPDAAAEGIGQQGQTPAAAAESPDVSMTVGEMCERFQVDMAHARHVSEQAVALFEATAGVHQLEPERRRLLETMGMLHNVGLETDPERHHIAGRDIIQEHPLADVDEIEQRMLAAAVYLHRKRIRRRRLQKPVVASLPPGIQGDALALAALLRMADGLDYSLTQSSVLADIVVTPAAIHASVSGPRAQADAGRAQTKADLWERVFQVPFFFSAAEEGQAVRSSPDQAQGTTAETMSLSREADTPGLDADDLMSEAGRKVLRFHFWRMLKHEAGTRTGEDIEELHDMRVATRRMRAALRVFGSYFKASVVRPYTVGLRRTARALGAVRDLDVLLQKAHAYLGTLPEGQAQDLDPLLASWRLQRERSREDMVAYLDSAKYHDFVEAFGLFLEKPGLGVRKTKAFPPEPTLVRHVAPPLIYTRWAAVQAFGPALEGASVSTFHALRIECKRLRYTLEFFEEVLGEEARQVIREVVALQDHLGNLNDADVANGLLSDFLFASPGGGGSERIIAPGVVAYLAVKQRELQRLIESFPQVWETFSRAEVRRGLGSAVSVL